MKHIQYAGKATGFTLIEIILTLSLIGIVFGISSWRWIDSYDKRHINQSAQTIQQALFDISYHQELGHSGYLIIDSEQKTAQIFTSQNHLPSALNTEDIQQLCSPQQIYTLTEASISYKLPQATHWQPLKNSQTKRHQPLIWSFQSNGSLEPLSLRWQINESYLEHDYHPIAKVPYETRYQFY